MSGNKQITLTGNEAVAQIAYKVNEVCAIYPITPSSDMSEKVEEWSAMRKENIFGMVPSVFEMQSEAGVAGAMHGALQTGSLSTTFTASQGLLLMLPNMYKIAGELTPNVIHVATRSLAAHALSIYGDHSDVMAVRSSGYAMLASGSVQEAQDFALIAQAATLKARIPFVHFFDGFRTSHESSKIYSIPDSDIMKMMDNNDIAAHRNRALNPNSPVIRGTSQGSDIFFQSREAVNSYYNACPDIVQNKMDAFAELTGRKYKLFEYAGHSEAEHIIVAMASACETIEETIKHLNAKGEKYGLIKVRLFRPFGLKHLLGALPLSTKTIAVLDKTKEPGATAEPLYSDVSQSLTEAYQNQQISSLPQIFGGRYGLASKEFTPQMIQAVFNNLKSSNPKNHFTIGINDDTTYLSLPNSKETVFKNSSKQILFYQYVSSANKNKHDCISRYIGKTTDSFVQSYSECDYNKAASRNVKHLRVDTEQIKAPYLISDAETIICQDKKFLTKDTALSNLKENGTALVFSSEYQNDFWHALSPENQIEIIEKNASLLLVNQDYFEEHYEIDGHRLSPIEASYLAIAKESNEPCIEALRRQIIKVDTSIQSNFNSGLNEEDDFESQLLFNLLESRNIDLPVSKMPADGTFQSKLSFTNQILGNNKFPIWNPNSCTQCGACSMACPQSAIRIKACDNDTLINAPNGFKSIPSKDFDLLNYAIQIDTNQCNGCNNCIDACDIGSLVAGEKGVDNEDLDIFFKNIPELDRTKIDATKLSEQQLQEPLFKYSNGDLGCGEAPYIKLISQLFGDRLLVANATGSSSIFGGAIPSLPWTKNKEGKGPAWSNSLFEDNAEFGLGFRLTLDQQESEAKYFLKKMADALDFRLVNDILHAQQVSESEVINQQNRVSLLNDSLIKMNTAEAQRLQNCTEALVKKSVWCIGGDGWAYDIGYGGLDHVMASDKNVNILILDNEVYSNTGGQMSKATPMGASAKFAHSGKTKQKKDFGKIAMAYDNVFVASVAIGADRGQTLKALIEAESFDGPSVVIAYCHSDSHGIDMTKPSQYHKAAVASGQWPLYRNDPRLKRSFQLDSPSPSIKIEEYLRKETRFDTVLNSRGTLKENLINQLQSNVTRRFEHFHSLI